MTLGARLGEGGFGIVYKAKWRNDDVAVKQIKPDLVQGNAVRAREEFRNELQQLFSLRHRHIVNCYGGGCEREFFIVTELMERGSLQDCLDRHAREFAWDRLGRKVLHDAAKGLLFLHEQQLVHFDVKPLNVLVNADNQGKLADVGLTKRLMQTVTVPQGWTPTYAAPEVLLRRGAGLPSDIYSFGVMIWQVHVHTASTSRTCFALLCCARCAPPDCLPWLLAGDQRPQPQPIRALRG